MSFKLKTFEELTTSMVSWIRANTDKITDFTEGSTNRTLLEAVASVIEELYIKVNRGLRTLIEETLYIVFEFPTLPQKKATGTVIFSRSTPATSDYIIAVGTVVSTEKTSYSNEVRFITTKTVTLKKGETYVEAEVEADLSGSSGNVEAGKITVFITKPAGVETVTNPLRFLNGRDPESPVTRKQRFREYISTRARGTLSALEYAAKEVPGVKSAKAVESPFVYAVSSDVDSFTDISLSANDPYEVPVNLLPETPKIDNCIYFGAALKFNFLYLKFSSVGVGVSGTWEYFDGELWKEVLDVVDGTESLTKNGVIKLPELSDWKDTKVLDTWAFWIRFRDLQGTYTTTPKVNHVVASPPPGVVELYIESPVTEATLELLEEVKPAVAAYRCGGIKINVLSCKKKLLSLVASIKVNTIEYDKVIIQNEVKTVIINYLNGFNMGESFFKTQLITQILAISGGRAVTSCDLDIDDVLVSPGEIIKPDIDTITVVVVN